MTWYARNYPTRSTPNLFEVKRGYVNDKPRGQRYHGVSPSFHHEVTTQGGYPMQQTAWFSAFVSRSISPSLGNKLNAKFRDQLSSNVSAQLLTSLVEVGESYNMIARRAITLRRAFSALRRFDLPRVARELALPRDVQRNVERRVSKKHYVTSNWMEYWMGWAPMVSDIQNALRVLDQQPRSKKFRVSSTENFTYVANGFKYWSPRWGDQFASYLRCSVSDRASFGGYATCVNPQLALASQLGLTDPFATAWEVVPFSFIANWVVNLDQYISSCSPFYGWELSETYVTLKSTIPHALLLNSESEWQVDKWVRVTRVQSMSSMLFYRRPSELPPVTLAVSLPDRLSLSRAATSVSLLTQLFLKP